MKIIKVVIKLHNVFNHSVAASMGVVEPFSTLKEIPPKQSSLHVCVILEGHVREVLWEASLPAIRSRLLAVTAPGALIV